jgi:hypothetical protein
MKEERRMMAMRQRQIICIAKGKNISIADAAVADLRDK